MDTVPTVDIDEIAAALGPGFLDTEDVATALKVSCRTVEDWRLSGRGPRFIRMSPRCVRYRPRELARWIAEREVSSTSEPVGAA